MGGELDLSQVVQVFSVLDVHISIQMTWLIADANSLVYLHIESNTCFLYTCSEISLLLDKQLNPCLFYYVFGLNFVCKAE